MPYAYPGILEGRPKLPAMASAIFSVVITSKFLFSTELAVNAYGEPEVTSYLRDFESTHSTKFIFLEGLEYGFVHALPFELSHELKNIP